MPLSSIPGPVKHIAHVGSSSSGAGGGIGGGAEAAEAGGGADAWRAKRRRSSLSRSAFPDKCRVTSASTADCLDTAAAVDCIAAADCLGASCIAGANRLCASGRLGASDRLGASERLCASDRLGAGCSGSRFGYGSGAYSGSGDGDRDLARRDLTGLPKRDNAAEATLDKPLDKYFLDILAHSAAVEPAAQRTRPILESLIRSCNIRSKTGLRSNKRK
jgi:hypothetical protein